jgi:hypothetical protein
LSYLETEHHVADILTKPLQRPQFQRFARQLLGHEPTMSAAVVRSLEKAGELFIAAAASAAQRLLIKETIEPEEQYEREERAYSAREELEITMGGPGNAAMENASLMMGSAYSSDMTGDGPGGTDRIRVVLGSPADASPGSPAAA